jgi:hypothetical protein
MTETEDYLAVPTEPIPVHNSQELAEDPGLIATQNKASEGIVDDPESEVHEMEVAEDILRELEAGPADRGMLHDYRPSTARAGAGTDPKGPP